MGERKDETNMGKTRDALNEEEVIFCSGYFCMIGGLLCTDCIGCMGDAECLCCRHQFCCKSGTDMLCCTAEEEDCCQLGCGCCAYSCKSPVTCCKREPQCSCFVTLCAFPCTDEIPYACGDCGLSCLPKCGCCLKLKDLGAVDPSQHSETPTV